MKRAAGARAVERYDQLLRTHVLRTLGKYKLQQIHSTDIDKLYLNLEGKIAPRTVQHVPSWAPVLAQQFGRESSQ